MSTTPPGDRPGTAAPSGTPPARLDLGVAQVAGSALAAVTAAVAASTLGVAGTILGAGVGAVVATVGSALYTHSMHRASARVREMKLLELRSEGGLRWPGPRSGGAGLDSATRPQTTVGATEPLGTQPVPTQPLGTETSDALLTEPTDAGSDDSGRSWRRGAVVVGGGFALAIAGITAAEAVLGHPLSTSRESGTSIGRAVTGDTGSGGSTPGTSTPTTSETTSPTSSTSSVPTSSPTSTQTEQSSTSTTAPAATSPDASQQGTSSSPAVESSTSSEAPAPEATSPPASPEAP